MNYLFTSLEDFIKELYTQLEIKEVAFSISEIAEKLNIELLYSRFPYTVPGVIVLNPSDSPEQQREVFAHELCHELQHAGSQLKMPDDFRRMQEWKAENFALHFCIPTFLLQKIKFSFYRSETIKLIADNFLVSPDFAERRLIRYEKQLIGNELHFKLLDALSQCQ